MTIENNLIAKALLHKQFTFVQSKEESRTRIARKMVDGKITSILISDTATGLRPTTKLRTS